MACLQHGTTVGPACAHILQAGHKRAKALAVPVSSARELPEASQAAAIPADISAKRALENEFECIICRVMLFPEMGLVDCDKAADRAADRAANALVVAFTKAACCHSLDPVVTVLKLCLVMRAYGHHWPSTETNVCTFQESIVCRISWWQLTL